MEALENFHKILFFPMKLKFCLCDAGMKTTSSRRILVIAAVAMFLIVAIGFAIIRYVVFSVSYI